MRYKSISMTKTTISPFTVQLASESPIHDLNGSTMHNLSLNFDDRILSVSSFAKAI